MGVTATYISEDTARKYAKAYVRKCGGLANAADEMGVSVQYVSMMVNGKKPLSPKFLQMMGLTRITLYELGENCNVSV